MADVVEVAQGPRGGPSGVEGDVDGVVSRVAEGREDVALEEQAPGADALVKSGSWTRRNIQPPKKSG